MEDKKLHVLQFSPKSDGPKSTQETVKYLERLLEMTKANEIDVVLVGYKTGDTSGYFFGGLDGANQMMHALGLLDMERQDILFRLCDLRGEGDVE